MTIIGSKIIRLDKTESTQAEAKNIAGSASEGTVVIANEQSAGRGKPGTSWFSPPGLGLYLSIILKPRKNPTNLQPLTFLSSRAVIETIFDRLRFQGTIKPPNDIMLSGKKAGGILTEKTNEAVVVGIGINLNNTKFPDELKDSVTSLKLATGKEVRKEEFLNSLLKFLDLEYSKFLRSG